jgi:hypothetical protein
VSYTLAFALQLRKKHGKTSVRATARLSVYPQTKAPCHHQSIKTTNIALKYLCELACKSALLSSQKLHSVCFLNHIQQHSGDIPVPTRYWRKDSHIGLYSFAPNNQDIWVFTRHVGCTPLEHTSTTTPATYEVPHHPSMRTHSAIFSNRVPQMRGPNTSETTWLLYVSMTSVPIIRMKTRSAGLRISAYYTGDWSNFTPCHTLHNLFHV